MANVNEIISKRTLNTKHFYNDGEFEAKISVGHVHYFDKLDSNRFREIDFTLSFDEEKRGWYFNYHSFRPFLPEYADEWVEFRDLFDGKDQTIKYKALASHIKGRLVNPADIGLNNIFSNCVIYDDAFGTGFDYILYFTRSALKKVVRIRDGFKPDNDIRFDFEIDFPEKNKFRAQNKDTISNGYEFRGDSDKTFDSDKQLLVGDDNDDGQEWFTYLRNFKCWDDKRTETILVDYIVRDGKTFLGKKITSDFLNRSTGDVFTDTTTSFMAHSSDTEIYDWGGGTTKTWSNRHDASQGATVRSGAENMWVGYYAETTSPYWRTMRRGYLNIDTSSLADYANITSAKLNIYCYGVENTSGDNLLVRDHNSASNTSLALSDYNISRWGTTDYVSGVSIGSLSITAYTSLTLNTDGINAISKTGYTQLGLITGNDANDTAPSHPGEISKGAFAKFYTSESTEPNTAPYLSVTYTSGYSEEDWDYSKKLMIDSDKVSGTSNHTNFPVLIKDSNFSDHVYANAYYNQDFESLNLGDLSGQDGWTDTSNSLTVSTELPYSGSQGLKNSTAEATAFRDIPNNKKGRWDIYVRRTDMGGVARRNHFMIYDGATKLAQVQLKAEDNKFLYHTGGVAPDLKTGLSPNTWYKLSILWDSEINKIRYLVDDANDTGWVDPISAVSFNHVDQVELFLDNIVGTCYMDDMKIYDYKAGQLRFSTDSSGTNRLNFDVVNFDAATKKSEVWVKVPTLNYNSDTPFYVWYGKISAASPDVDNSIEGSEGVWTNYKLVVHADHNKISALVDNTSNNLTISTTGSMTDSDIVDGKTGKTIEFDGVNDFLTVGSAGDFDVIADEASVYQAWVKKDSNCMSFAHVFGYEGTATENRYVRHKYQSNGLIQYELRQNSGSGGENVNVTEDNNDYHLIHYVRAYNGADTVAVYVDGVATTDTDLTDDPSSGISNPLAIGAGVVRSGVPNASSFFGGTIGEMRIILGNKFSEDWAATEYANQNDPVTFFKTVQEESYAVSTTLGASVNKKVTKAANSSLNTSLQVGNIINANIPIGATTSSFFSSFLNKIISGVAVVLSPGKIIKTLKNIGAAFSMGAEASPHKIFNELPVTSTSLSAEKSIKLTKGLNTEMYASPVGNLFGYFSEGVNINTGFSKTKLISPSIFETEKTFQTLVSDDTYVRWNYTGTANNTNYSTSATINIANRSTYWINTGYVKPVIPASFKSAKLFLYCESFSEWTDKNIYIRRITSSIDYDTVTWNTKPTDTTTNQITRYIASSESAQWHEFDVTELLNDIVSDGNNYGLLSLIHI